MGRRRLVLDLVLPALSSVTKSTVADGVEAFGETVSQCELAEQSAEAAAHEPGFEVPD